VISVENEEQVGNELRGAEELGQEREDGGYK